MAFFGTHTIQMDDKNRMRIPAKFRAKLGGDYYIVYGAGGCLTILPNDSFEKFVAPFAKIPASDLEARESVRRILATVEQPEEDTQGRFVLPAHARAYAKIDKRVVFVGVGEQLEIWSEEQFAAKNIGEQNTFDNAVVLLGKYGL
ncbi:MAG: cell division/cell wall cluster transcriptional repressor MraZ [Clostridia bacterium]|nr:cell division/cell wall cluster transcriptional repressor MraZ [Clostridia bacterium]